MKFNIPRTMNKLPQNSGRNNQSTTCLHRAAPLSLTFVQKLLCLTAPLCLLPIVRPFVSCVAQLFTSILTSLDRLFFVDKNDNRNQNMQVALTTENIISFFQVALTKEIRICFFFGCFERQIVSNIFSMLASSLLRKTLPCSVQNYRYMLTKERMPTNQIKLSRWIRKTAIKRQEFLLRF